MIEYRIETDKTGGSNSTTEQIGSKHFYFPPSYNRRKAERTPGAEGAEGTEQKARRMPQKGPPRQRRKAQKGGPRTGAEGCRRVQKGAEGKARKGAERPRPKGRKSPGKAPAKVA